MSEDKTRFQSIYGDAEDEFEIEDVSDETLNMPTSAVRAAREDELEEIATESEAEANSVGDTAPEAADPAVRAEETDAEEDTMGQFPEQVEPESYLDEELEGVSFEESHEHYRDREIDEHGYREDASEGDVYEQDATTEPDDVSILAYIGHAILFTIPVIGTILMLVYIISDRRNIHLRHFAQIWLVTLIVVAIGLVVTAYMLGLA